MKVLELVFLVLVYQVYIVSSGIIKDLDEHVRTTRQSNFKEMMQNKMKNQNHCETPYSIHGTCQTMHECKIPEIEGKSFNAIEHLCVLGGKQIGVCCPDSFKAPTNHRINHINKLYNKDVSRIVNSSIRPEQRGCGISARQFPKIIGARAVDPEEWPWMVAITRKGHPAAWCGGSLITDRHILTAAHCIDKFKPKDLIVRLGEYNFKQLNETRFRDFNISAMVHHVDYDPSTYENDIALMRIEQPAIFNSYIWPVCMPPLGEIWHNYKGFITGWGTQHFSGPFSNILKEVNVPIWDLSSCRKKFVERLSDNMICAGDENGDSCQHDSGGPLMVQLPNKRWVLVGIVSWGIRCADKVRPGIYTRVDKFIPWIIENSSM